MCVPARLSGDIVILSGQECNIRKPDPRTEGFTLTHYIYSISIQIKGILLLFLGRISKYSEIVRSGCLWKSLVIYLLGEPLDMILRELEAMEHVNICMCKGYDVIQ